MNSRLRVFAWGTALSASLLWISSVSAQEPRAPESRNPAQYTGYPANELGKDADKDKDSRFRRKGCPSPITTWR